MTRTCIYTQPLIDCRDVALAGSKAANLGRLMRAGFPVPGGFVLTTRAFREAQKNAINCGEKTALEIPSEVAEDIRASYRAMRLGRVAVRSSATAEDGAETSMAGQYDTFLNVEGEANLLEAIGKCWESLTSPRIMAYFQEHGIDAQQVAMAVVVQRLVPADVAGVLFTANPNGNAHEEMLVEASWGLGESVVSGRVQPDVLRLDQHTGRVLSATIADKDVQLMSGISDEQQVDETRRRQACLKGRDVQGLWELGKRVAAHFDSPQDIEWALHADELYLLQARPITTLRDAEAYASVLGETRKHLHEELAARHGPWVAHNLGETLPHPTPLTWSVIQRFMSGAGGYGEMYRQAGFEPSPAVERAGFLDRIAGRIYMDTARAPEMFFADFPFSYDVEELKHSPDASQAPPTLAKGSLKSRMAAGRRIASANARLRALAADFDRQLHESFFPSVAQYVADAKTVEIRSIDAERLIELWTEYEDQVLDSMAPQLLMPSLISGLALGELKAFLADHFWQDDPETLSQLIASGGAANRTILADAELYEVGIGKRSFDSWISAHGHRAAGEFDLALPRWREQRPAVNDMATRLSAGEDPLERQRRHAASVDARIAELRNQLSPHLQKQFDQHIDLARRYVRFREDAKDFLMLGYDLLRDLALEAGRRLELGSDVFYLSREELFDSLRIGFAPYPLVEQRKRAYSAELRLALPAVIDQQVIEQLGKPADALLPQARVDGYRAYAVSSGEAAGSVRVLHSPTEAGDLGQGYILVCPSTDPSWTPLFVNAAALVLERGGALSHGAVVAREMGLPAVVLPNATQLFRDDESLFVDGTQGWVGRGAQKSSQTSSSQAAENTDTHVPFVRIPPPAGRKDRLAAKISGVLALLWTVYLLAFFALPQRWVYQPALRAFDVLLWPVVLTLGKPLTVAMIAAFIAVIMLVIQKYATDNRRLLEAKKRAAALQREANSLPRDTPRRKALMRLAAPVQFRTLIAAMVPVGILLGPLVMPFVWFKQRIDPSVWSPPAGSSVQVVATVDSDFGGPVSINLPPTITVDQATSASRTLLPIRNTLERLLALYRQPSPAQSRPGEPWELQVAPDLGRQQTINDLQGYLQAGIPPQGITWQIHTPEGFNGKIPLSVVANGHNPVLIYAVVGESTPPAERTAIGTADSPIKQVRLIYPQPKVEAAFWKPLAGFNVSWLWLYVLAYVPVLLLGRMALKVA